MDTVARFGGDEFVMILGELTQDPKEALVTATQIAQKIQDILGKKYVLESDAEGIVEHFCSVSIWGTLFGLGDESKEKILHAADQAMYLAKEAGRNQVRFI
jgi:diguanylate cyclase (GGDEF)-like protein